jgi:hypothetical protein
MVFCRKRDPLSELSRMSRPISNWNMNCECLPIVALRTAILSCILFAVAPIGLLAQTATIHVRVLDGRTGKSLSGMYLAFVDYHTDRDGSTHADLAGRVPVADLSGRVTVKTSAVGDSYVANPDAHAVLVFNGLGNRNGVWTPCARQKLYDNDTRTYGSELLYPVSKIVASGLVASNHCGRRTATAKPGELVIFVRHPTWWEKLMSVFES